MCRRSAETVPGYEHTGWFGIMAPVGIAEADCRSAHAEIRAIIAKPEVQAYWEKQDTQTMSMTPEESEAFIKADIRNWRRFVKAANIKAPNERRVQAAACRRLFLGQAICR